jgi:micrococcal nuclease
MYEYSCTIRRVVDGDTVDVDIDLGFDIILTDQRIRLHGIDAPESRTTDTEEKKFGLLAKDFLKSKLGKKALLKTHKDAKGKFGRILGEFTVYDGEKDRWITVNQLMIEKKFAVPYFGQSKSDIEQAHLDNRKYLYESGMMDGSN